MDKPIISKDFTLEDIRKLRDYNSTRHLIMSREEIEEEGKIAINWFLSEMGKRGSNNIKVLQNR